MKDRIRDITGLARCLLHASEVDTLARKALSRVAEACAGGDVATVRDALRDALQTAPWAGPTLLGALAMAGGTVAADGQVGDAGGRVPPPGS